MLYDYKKSAKKLLADARDIALGWMKTANHVVSPFGQLDGESVFDAERLSIIQWCSSMCIYNKVADSFDFKIVCLQSWKEGIVSHSPLRTVRDASIASSATLF